MKSVQMQLTSVCNERCFMCRKYTWSKLHMSCENVKKYIEKYKECTFTFSGGDPLAFENLSLLNELLQKHKIKYQVFTNMNYVLNEAQAEFLENAEHIQVSFDGSCSATYDSVRRSIENGFDIVLGNMLNYKDKVKANCTVGARNYFDVHAIYRICLLNDIVIRFYKAHTNDDACLKPWMERHILAQFGKDIPKEVERLLASHTEEEYVGKCFVKKHHRVIDESGKEYPCCRAINDNGEDWGGLYSLDSLGNIEDENVLYEFCKHCDRYRKFNSDWGKYNNVEGLYL